MKGKKKKETEILEIIFVSSFYHKKAKRRIYARDCGKTAFPIKIKKIKDEEKNKNNYFLN